MDLFVWVPILLIFLPVRKKSTFRAATNMRFEERTQKFHFMKNHFI